MQPVCSEQCYANCYHGHHIAACLSSKYDTLHCGLQYSVQRVLHVYTGKWPPRYYILCTIYIL